MDLSKFLQPSGTLVSVNLPHKDYAFLPSTLPPDWSFPGQLWPLLVKAHRVLGELNGASQFLNDPNLLLIPLRNREALTSSALEGTFISPKDLHLLGLSEGASHSSRLEDWREVSNYRTALEVGQALLKELPICGRVIREMHKSLMKGVRGQEKTPGEYRNIQVQIGSSARFIPPPAELVPDLMQNYEAYSNEVSGTFDPLVKAYLLHYQFETIHPFCDGNGRIGRALLSLMTQIWMKHPIPLLYMSAFFEKYKDEYIEKLFRVSSESAWDVWLEFCLNGTIEQASDALLRCKMLLATQLSFREIATEKATARTYPLIDLLFSTPVIDVVTVRDRFNVTYNTAKRDLEKLVDCKILNPIEDISPITYYAPKIMRIAYASTEEIFQDWLDSQKPPE